MVRGDPHQSRFAVQHDAAGDQRDARTQLRRIINISSINGQKGQLGLTNYCSAKAGVIGFTRSLALESARKGVTVNAIAPGYIKTDLLAGVSEEVMNSIVGRIPIGRLGEADEVARCVVFLAADASAWITAPR